VFGSSISELRRKPASHRAHGLPRLADNFPRNLLLAQTGKSGMPRVRPAFYAMLAREWIDENVK
jgi:hypothetical protein